MVKKKKDKPKISATWTDLSDFLKRNPNYRVVAGPIGIALKKETKK